MASEYDSIETAAIAAHTAIQQIKDSNKYEYITVIYEDPKTGKYKFTKPVTEGKRSRANKKIKIPKGSARGLFHNHPQILEGGSDDLQQYFSEGDMDLAQRTGLLSFIGAADQVFRWNPHDPGKTQSKGGSGSTIKEKVGIGEPIYPEIEAE